MSFFLPQFIRADATVASNVDCFLGPTGFTLVCEEAATLVLAGQHLVDFFDFEIINAERTQSYSLYTIKKNKIQVLYVFGIFHPE
jgi:hypothetical protein